MSGGYKRVNFYELCRLCATNQQKDKTHIFQEEGRKIQLQTKIQSCLSLTVCENDFLPKVVCSKCLGSLEVCYSFRQECVTSESMLSSYFKNFRYTEDFKKSGKVYIKDTKSTPPPVQAEEAPVYNEVKPAEPLPFYTVQLPTIVENKPKIEKAPVGYNLNLAPIKTAPKIGDSLSNVVVNANGEVLNIAQLVDFESIINQANLQKIKAKLHKKKEVVPTDPVIKIDLTNPEENYDTGQGKVAKNNKFAYAIKVDENKVIYNNLGEFNHNGYNGFTNPNLYGTNMLNGGNPNIICNNVESTVNLNVLNQDLTQPSNFRSFIPAGKVEDSGTTTLVANPAAKTHLCEICQKSFKRREHLYQHVKLHTGFRPYTCENCNKSFMRKEHLLRHMTSHSGQKNFTCNICEKSFSRNDNLLKHKKTHEKQTSYTCDICQKQFVMKHYYLAHKLTHEGDRCSLANVWNVLKT